jgi:hypothetical protein
MTALFWTYHGAYDFVFLLPVVMPLAGWSEKRPARDWSVVGLIAFAVIAAALFPPVYGGDDMFGRAIRWCARLIVPALFANELIRPFAAWLNRSLPGWAFFARGKVHRGAVKI